MCSPSSFGFRPKAFCAPWHDGRSKYDGRLWWPCVRGTRGAACGQGSKVERCASLLHSSSKGRQIRGPKFIEVRFLSGEVLPVNSCSHAILQHFPLCILILLQEIVIYRPLRRVILAAYQARVIGLSLITQTVHFAQSLMPGTGLMTDMTDAPKGPILRRLPLIVILLVAVSGAFLLRDYLSFETLSKNREDLIAFRDAHYPLTALAFIAIYVVIVAFSLPGATVATLTGGFLFGLFPGAFFNVVAATFGATAIFLAARWGLGDRLTAKLDKSEGAVRKLREGLKENELSVLFLLRLVPVVPFFVANLLPALVGVSVKRFIITTFLGIIPGGVVYTWVGAGLGEVFARGETPNLGIIFEPIILLPILALCVLAALPIVFKAFGRKRD